MSETTPLNEKAWEAAYRDLDLALHAAGIRTNGVPVMTLAGIAVRAYLESVAADTPPSPILGQEKGK